MPSSADLTWVIHFAVLNLEDSRAFLVGTWKRNSEFINRKPDGFLGQAFVNWAEENGMSELGGPLLSRME